MSIQHVSNVLDTPSLSSAQTLVMAVLAEHASPGGIAFPGMMIIGARTKMTPPTLRGHLKSLEEQGWIRVLTKGNGRGVITRYALNISRLEEEATAARAERNAGKESDWFPEKGLDSFSFSDDEKGERNPPKGESLPPKGERNPPKGESHGTTNRINPSNHVVVRPRMKVWAKPMGTEGLVKLKERFCHLDVEEEISFAMDHEARFKSSDEYLYLLKWMKNARGNSSPKFSGNQQQVKPTPSRDDWGMTPEQWREAILAAGGDLD